MFSLLEKSPAFINIINPLLDILILAFLFYQIYNLLVQTRALQLVRGVIFLAALYVFAFLLNLKTLLWLMTSLGTILLIVLAVVFQPELRGFFNRIGRQRWLFWAKVDNEIDIDTVLTALEILASRRRGALIVISRRMSLKQLAETGTLLKANPSSSLLLTIFGHNTPLHDGAVLIGQGQILAAGCFLPLSEQIDIKRSFGSRHRAALGMAETTDALVLVASEETGAISLAYDANLHYDMAIAELSKTMRGLLEIDKNRLPTQGGAII